MKRTALALLMLAACNRSDPAKDQEIAELRSKVATLSAVKQAPMYPDETEEYLQATARTAIAGHLSPDDFRASLRTLAVRCKRSKIEVYRYLRGVAQGTGNLKGAIESAPEYCDLADYMDRPLSR